MGHHWSLVNVQREVRKTNHYIPPFSSSVSRAAFTIWASVAGGCTRGAP